MSALCNSMMMANSKPFVFSVKTNNAGTSGSTQFTMPTVSTGTYNCVVNWGDGTSSTITTYNDAAWTHTFSGGAGTYTVTISGIFNGIQFNNGGDCLKFLNISQWGNMRLGNANSYFYGCSNLTITATDVLNLTGTTDLSIMFRNCTSLVTVPNISSWNVLSITNFSQLFSGCASFNQALTWTCTAATNMSSMFISCTSLNSAITFTGTGSVTTFASMFQSCSVYNQNLTLTTTAATTMASMFQSCLAFNSTLTFSSTANVTNFSNIFNVCQAFNQALTWTTTSASNMSGMFGNCNAFNSTLTFSSVASVTNFAQMFINCSALNKALTWTTTAATNMSGMFQGCSALNSAITFTGTGSVTTFASMFQSCTIFNQALTLTTTAAINIGSMFQSCPAFNSAISFSSTANVTTMTNTFNSCTVFNQDVSVWSIAALTNATGMFTSSGFALTNYNKLLDSTTGWPSQGTIQSNVTFSAGTAQYSGTNAVAGRLILTGTKTWTITDGGLAPQTWATWNASLDGSAQSAVTGVVVAEKNLVSMSTSSVVQVYHNLSDDLIYAQAGTVSGTSTTWGTPVSVSNVLTGQNPTICTLSSTTAVITYMDLTTAKTTLVVAITISGNTVTTGIPSIVYTDSTQVFIPQIVNISSTQAVVVFGGTSDHLVKGNTVTVTGTSVAFGTQYTLSGATTAQYFCANNLNSAGFFLCYVDNSAFLMYGVLIGFASGILTVNTPTSLVPAHALGRPQSCRMSAVQIGLLYQDATLSNGSYVMPVAISGTSVSAGTAALLTSVSLVTAPFGFCQADANDLFAVWHVGTTNTQAGTITISGTTATANTPLTYTASNYTLPACRAMDASHVITVFTNNSSSSAGYGRISSIV